jgi:hypothetical protein
MNGTVTGTLLASVLVAALEHQGMQPDPVYDMHGLSSPSPPPV